MPKSENQKLKLFFLFDILKQNTDDQHFISMQEIIAKLSLYDIKAERKSIYDDLHTLIKYGVDIISQKGSNPGYAIASREFELAELKLLVESVQSSRFITPRKSEELIDKLESLCSKYQANQLQRQVYVANRIKAMNESIYYVVDDIHQAISENIQIQFKYMEWNTKKELIYKKNGEYYVVSPYALCIAQDNYYMIAYETATKKIKHYRVDKMKNVACLLNKREGEEYFKYFDTALYSKQMFSMFGGETEKVKLVCKNNLIGVIIDRFGKDIFIKNNEDDTFTAVVEVAVSDQFFGWLFGLGDGAKIVSPVPVVEKMKRTISMRSKLYE